MVTFWIIVVFMIGLMTWFGAVARRENDPGTAAIAWTGAAALVILVIAGALVSLGYA